MICTVALFVAMVLVLSGNMWTVVGIAWCAMLYVSGVAFPKFWKKFWVTNMRILAHFGCL